MLSRGIYKDEKAKNHCDCIRNTDMPVVCRVGLLVDAKVYDSPEGVHRIGTQTT